MESSTRELKVAGLAVASILMALGTAWAFTRGGNDFAVFHAAWQLVLAHRGPEIYSATPDRFLYAPGFAWVLSPLGLLPRGVALALWCFAKAAVIGGIVRELSRRTDARAGVDWAELGLAAWAVALIARPILIDFQYGQVNLLILGACFFALARHCRAGAAAGAGDAWAWGALAVAAVAKLFPLPLLAIPFIPAFRGYRPPSGRLARERVGVIVGLLLVLLAPVTTQGWAGTWDLMRAWKLALVDRGLPLESHNQSFTAFLYHYLSGYPTEIIAEGRRRLDLGFAILSPAQIAQLSVGWLCFWMGVILALVLRGPLDRRRWIALLIGLMVIPSHLVWKPYFCFGLPAAILAMQRIERDGGWLLLVFVVLNLSGFDLIGHDQAARLEAFSLLLWTHFGILYLATRA